jgi:hypothetical protein
MNTTIGGLATTGSNINHFQSRLATAIEDVVQRPTLYGSPMAQANQGNAQWVYGERLAALFGVCISVEGASTEVVHFSVFADCAFSCNVSNVTVTGVRYGRFHMSMTLEDLEKQEAIEELFNKSGI